MRDEDRKLLADVATTLRESRVETRELNSTLTALADLLIPEMSLRAEVEWLKKAVRRLWWFAVVNFLLGAGAMYFYLTKYPPA